MVRIPRLLILIESGTNNFKIWIKGKIEKFCSEFAKSAKLFVIIEQLWYIVNMASAGEKPPDATLTKFSKCHPQTKVGAVLCLMCQNFFHTNEIVSKYNSGWPVKFINNALIISQDCPNVALTSNLPYNELSSEAMQLIAQINLEIREQVKQEIIKEMNLEKLNNKQKGLNDTVFEDYG